MSDDEFTQHELHPSSPPPWDGAVWDHGSQPLWDDDASQTLWVPSPPHTLAQLPSAASPRLTLPPIGFSASPTCVPVGRPSPESSDEAAPTASSCGAHSGVSPLALHSQRLCSSSHAEPPASSNETDLGWQSVREVRPTRRAALDSGRRTSNLYVAGGILDSQTSDSQYLGWKEENIEINLSSDCSEVEAADMGSPIVDTSSQELARVRIELANTRRQLYEYVGRWALARTHISRLDWQLSGGTFRV
ncbi:hypothetical protein TRAPUB_12645 [Trametes pubescens]|uniref:Uncharacterized protein n=1 Tax=Trametes pubescens TaxID=154538 RepID=A0A1M2VTA0_TRAPU|nr:hypothetical protein TRAPUB_12645 [Trametes pubescens]